MLEIVLLVISLGVGGPLQSETSISEASLLEMAERGVSAPIVLEMVREYCVDFDVNPEIASRLAGRVSDQVVLAAIICRRAKRGSTDIGKENKPVVPVKASSGDALPSSDPGVWSSVYGRAGFVYHLPVGAEKPEILGLLARSDDETVDALLCMEEGGLEMCQVDPGVLAGFSVRTHAGVAFETLGVMFTNLQVVGYFHLIGFLDGAEGAFAFKELSEALTASFKAEGQPRDAKELPADSTNDAAAFARQIFSKLLPGESRQELTWNKKAISTRMILKDVAASGRGAVVLVTLDSNLVPPADFAFPNGQSVVAASSLRKPAWEAAYGDLGFVYHLPLSVPKGQIVEALGGQRSADSPLACEVDAESELCDIAPEVLKTFAIKGEELIGEALGVLVRHGMAEGFLHLLAFEDRESAVVAYNGIDAALTRSYGHPPRKPFKIEGAKSSGYLVRKLFGALIPGDTKKKAGWGSGMIESNMYLGHHKKTGRWTVGVITLDHALNE